MLSVIVSELNQCFGLMNVFIATFLIQVTALDVVVEGRHQQVSEHNSTVWFVRHGDAIRHLFKLVADRPLICLASTTTGDGGQSLLVE